jgi:hypothetical protein
LPKGGEGGFSWFAGVTPGHGDYTENQRKMEIGKNESNRDDDLEKV